MRRLPFPWLCGAAFIAGLPLLSIGRHMADAQIDPTSEFYLKNLLLLWWALPVANLLMACGIALVAGGPLAAAAYWLRRCGVDRLSLLLFIAASLVSLHYIHISRDTSYTNDLGGHLDYAYFLRSHWLEPYGYHGRQDHHPPVYYYIAALAIWLAEASHAVATLTALRFLSWLCTLVFAGFSLLTLRRANLEGAGYYACAALLLFWPAGIHLASVINSEALFYPCYAAAFYYALLWYQEGAPRQLKMALAITGAAFAVRTNAVVLVAIMPLFLGLSRRRHHFRWKSLLARGWILPGGVFASGLLINGGKLLHRMLSGRSLAGYWGHGNAHPFSTSHFLFFDYRYAVTHPFNDWTPNQSFWDYLLKTAIFEEYPWGWPGLAAGLDALLYAIVLYAALPWLIARRAEGRGIMPFALGFLMPLAFLTAYAGWKHTPSSQDFRYIFPALSCFAALFGRSHALLKTRGMALASWAGPALAWSFALLSVIFFWTQGR